VSFSVTIAVTASTDKTKGIAERFVGRQGRLHGRHSIVGTTRVGVWRSPVVLLVAMSARSLTPRSYSFIEELSGGREVVPSPPK
jgi:hypothetical protein